MSRIRTRRSRAELLGDAPSLDQWPAPDIERDVRPDKVSTYSAQRLALELWAANEPAKSIRKRTGLDVARARELAHRAVRLNPRTRHIVGFWACVPNHITRKAKNFRQAPFKADPSGRGSGQAGALDAFFERHPAIHKALVEFIQKRKTDSSAPIALLTPGTIKEAFLGLCHDHGLENSGEWPFNAERRGYEAIRRWYHQERWKAPIKSAANSFGDDAGKLARVDFATIGRSSARRRLMAYEHTQFDEHFMDAMWEVVYPMRGGEFASLTATRLWALVMCESRSTAVLSSSISYRQKYDRSDVTRLVLRALEPPARYAPRLPDSPNYQYRENAAYPAELSDFSRFGWNTLSYDADSAHVAETTVKAICDVVGCRPSSERIGSQPGRVIVEGYFGKLTRLLEGSPAATGSRPDSPARRDPQAAALKYQLHHYLAEELLDLICRNHNSTPSAACDGLTPLMLLKDLMARGECYRMPLGTLSDTQLWRLLPLHRATLTKKRGGWGPLGVNLFGARYVSKDLATDPVRLPPRFGVHSPSPENAGTGARK